MTYDDAYVVMCLCGVIFTVAALVGFCVDRWPEWKRRAETHRMYARIQTQWLLADMARRRGSVSRPADPSPRRSHDRDGVV